MTVGSAVWLAGALGMGGVATLRYAWSRPRRVGGWNALGWAALIAAVCVGWRHAGAWGVSIVALLTMTAALIALAVAALRSPAGRTPSSNRRAGMLPQRGEPRRIGRRVITFLLVMPVGFVAAVILALATRSISLLFGSGAPDANVIALYMVPIAWAALATIVLMQERRRAQITALLACALVGTPFLLTGLGS